MRKTSVLTALPDPFALTDRTLERMANDYGLIDIEKTLDRFVRKADALGWMYKNWQSAFLNYCDNGEKFGGVVYRAGKSVDPRWTPVLNESKRFGFREPAAHETPSSYKTAFEQWKSAPKVERPINVTNLLKSV